MKPIKLTSREISGMPLAERRAAVANVVRKAESIGLQSRLCANLKNYLDVTTVTPHYSPIFHLEPAHEWNGSYSLWNQFGTDPATGTKTFVRQHALYSNEQANQETYNITAENNRALARNESERARLSSENERVSRLPIPTADLDVLINNYNKIAGDNNYRRFSRAFKNEYMKLSSSPFDRSSIDMFAGILRGSNG